MANSWVYCRIGEIVGLVHKDVYDIFLEEWKRLQIITESDKITPNLEAMVVNSANTPTESLT